MDALVSELEAKTAEARLGGGAKTAARFRSTGKKLPRERCAYSSRTPIKRCNITINSLALLLDPHTPFLELSPLAAHGVYPDAIPGAGLITGIGRINGRECMVIVNDPTVKGGAYYPLTVRHSNFLRLPAFV